jgi:hypothetical protein
MCAEQLTLKGTVLPPHHVILLLPHLPVRFSSNLAWKPERHRHGRQPRSCSYLPSWNLGLLQVQEFPRRFPECCRPEINADVSRWIPSDEPAGSSRGRRARDTEFGNSPPEKYYSRFAYYIILSKIRGKLESLSLNPVQINHHGLDPEGLSTRRHHAIVGTGAASVFAWISTSSQRITFSEAYKQGLCNIQESCQHSSAGEIQTIHCQADYVIFIN